MATNPTEVKPDLITLDELAARMGISLTTAYKLARKDALPVPVIRVGPQYRFSRRAFDALIGGTSEAASTDAA